MMIWIFLFLKVKILAAFINKILNSKYYCKSIILVYVLPKRALLQINYFKMYLEYQKKKKI